MSVAISTAKVEPEACEESSPTPGRAGAELSALLAALSSVLGDTLRRFEDLSGRVTESILTRGPAIDHDLIMALQGFDRLQQELAAIGEVMTYCASASDDREPVLVHQQAIARVNLADMKSRLREHLRAQRGDLPAAPADEIEQVF